MSEPQEIHVRVAELPAQPAGGALGGLHAAIAGLRAATRSQLHTGAAAALQALRDAHNTPAAPDTWGPADDLALRHYIDSQQGA